MKDLDAGAVDVLLILGGNPAFNSPVELGMGDRMKKAKLRIRLGLYADETSQVCQWQVPETHFLETWGDARAFDGTVTIQQPLIAAALRRTLGDADCCRSFTEQPEKTPYDIVKGYWNSAAQGRRFRSLVAARRPRRRRARTRRCRRRPSAVRGEALAARAGAKKLEGKLEVIFRPDPTIYDGRFANNGWLQELPKPITKLTWDNAAFLSPATAHRFGVQTGDMLKLTYDGRSLNAPVFIQPGHVNGATTLHLGYGRTHAGRAGTGMGFNPYGLRTAKALWQDVGLDAEKTAGQYEFASTQNFT